MPGKFELKTASDGQFMFNLKAANGEVILTSELYTRKENALNGIESVRKNGGASANFERKTSVKGDNYFVLK
ncbi:MAG TPA: YegP family protein, partial [Lentisphaeria bacterium]|nr:YegP family protein [Lentisphaeria bacterium]